MTTKALDLAALRGRRRWTKTEAIMAIRALRASGGTVAGFAREHGLHQERLRRWRKRVGKDAMAPVATKLVPVDVITASAGPKFEVVIGGIVVRVPTTFDEAALRRLLGVVAAC